MVFQEYRDAVNEEIERMIEEEGVESNPHERFIRMSGAGRRVLEGLSADERQRLKALRDHQKDEGLPPEVQARCVFVPMTGPASNGIIDSQHPRFLLTEAFLDMAKGSSCRGITGGNNGV